MWSISEFKFLLNEVSVVYDVHYVLRDNSFGDGTFLIKYRSVDFDLSITGNNTDKSISSEIKQMGVNAAGGQYKTEIKAHPLTPQIQVIGRQVRLFFFLCNLNIKHQIIFFLVSKQSHISNTGWK